jgi:hypothetical protein
MSGYTDQAMRQHSLSIDGPELLEKPFTATTLLQTVREVLDDQPSEVGVPRQRTRGVS